MPRVSVVVVSFNTREALRRCLDSIEPHHEVIVVDNASVDGSAEMVSADFPSVVLIRNEDNRGFGAANNQGRRVATGQFILYLNSDAWGTRGAIDNLADALTDDVVAAGGMLLNPDGTLQNSSANELTLWAVFCEQAYLENVFRVYWNSFRLDQSDLPSETAQVMGACLMTCGQLDFDERFFLYCEDTDLCRRLNGRILYVPSAVFFHELGVSSSSNRWLAVARYNAGKELYFRLHHGPFASFVCFLLNRGGALARLLVWGLASPFVRVARGKALLFAKVLFAPIGPLRFDT